MKIDIEREILDSLGKQMAEDIDFEVLAGVLCTFGWTKVEMFHHAMGEVDTWLAKNCKMEYKRHKDTFIFEDAQDANWFKLRWL